VIAIKLWAVISGNIIDICLVLIKLVTSLRVHFTNNVSEAPQSMANIRSVGEKNKDRYGRNIIQVEGHDLCNNFNYGTCKWKDCKFSHACLKCKGKGHLIGDFYIQLLVNLSLIP
jgi:hypothetical protein